MPKTFAPAPFSNKPYEPIPMTPVESHQIAQVGYSPERRTLAVTFTRGAAAVYHYPNCEPHVFAEFMAADSKGRFFEANVRPMAFEKFAAPVAA